MAVSFLSYNKYVKLFGCLRNSRILSVTSKRSIMSTRPRLEKVLENLQKNPYYEKYSQKIAKLQQTSPEEFLGRVSENERKIQEEKVEIPASLQSVNLSRTFFSALCHQNRFQREISRNYSSSASDYKYITTPIFYVNDVPHIGHLYSAAVADTFARFNSMLGYKTILSTGTDEHGTKIERAAEKNKLPNGKYCDKISLTFKNMCDTFNIGYYDFIRTTENRHRVAVHNFWNKLSERGHIYSGKYSGWYCVSDEAFLSNDEITEKKNNKGELVKISLESGHPVEWYEEENFKFRLSAFQDDVRHWLKNENAVRPEKFYKILLHWANDERVFQDLSISRPTNRVPWGIQTPNDDTQSIYVWFDALINYLTILGYPDEKCKQFWPPSIQVIGKDILKFHGIFWPAFLIAAGYEPPETLLCHSHWTVEGQKMSKSNMNVVSPFDAASHYTPEGIRYFLLRNSVTYKDSNFSANTVSETLNADLADNLGNLVRRCTGDLINPQKEIPNPKLFADVLKSEQALELKKNLESLKSTAERNYESLDIHHAVDAVMTTLHSANQMFDYHRPWKLRKNTSDPAVANELKAVISLTLECARISALVLHPVIPKMTSDLLDFLQVPHENRTWQDTIPIYMEELSLNERHYIKDCKFFEKIRIAKK
ncbi:methionine--tRNA ligase, mitochondrial-like [Leptopilina heterotoma]|uniref:methionine--tRNA ligase, mitochondrial-like n=1 Tax=Leptopilina heterotoma TaxID=63436 RepID=UPI001CAA3D77|nr:methionine--tRNA ligase, mitochondrial-like [Leptopilina heterotoma]